MESTTFGKLLEMSNRGITEVELSAEQKAELLKQIEGLSPTAIPVEALTGLKGIEIK